DHGSCAVEALGALSEVVLAAAIVPAFVLAKELGKRLGGLSGARRQLHSGLARRRQQENTPCLDVGVVAKRLKHRGLAGSSGSDQCTDAAPRDDFQCLRFLNTGPLL